MTATEGIVRKCPHCHRPVAEGRPHCPNRPDCTWIRCTCQTTYDQATTNAWRPQPKEKP